MDRPRRPLGICCGVLAWATKASQPEVAMSRRDDLRELERAAWRALSSDGDAAADFYAEVLAFDVLMLLPGGLVIDNRAKVIESMRGAPWTSFDLANERVLDLTEDSAVVAYQATARRDGGEYTSLFKSIYVQEGGSWKLALHQQTPL